jgi:hypothetical protein
MGIEPTDLVGNKRFLAFFAGGMLPIISLSFLHMLVKFTEEDRVKENLEEKQITSNPEDLKNFVDETVRVRLSEDDLKKLEEVLLNPSKPNEELKKAAEEYKKRGELLAEIIKNDEEMGLYNDTSDWDVTLMDGLEDEEPFFTEEEIEKILQEEPTEEEIQQNFSIIERETENILQEEKEVKFEEDNQRMDIIGQNGNEGLHYENEPPPPPSPLLKPKLQEHKPKFVEYVNPNASENDEEKKNL